MIEELEEEVTEARAIAVRAGAVKLKTLEDESKKLSAELSDLRSKQEEASRDSEFFFSSENFPRSIQFISCRIQKQLKHFTAQRRGNETAEVS